MARGVPFVPRLIQHMIHKTNFLINLMGLFDNITSPIFSQQKFV